MQFSKLVLSVGGTGSLDGIITTDNLMSGTKEIHVKVEPGVSSHSDVTTARLIFNTVAAHIGRIPEVIALPSQID